MKKYLVLAFSIMISAICLGQENYREVVYLKNGQIIKGVIIELIPNKSIKIESSEGVISEFKIDEIEKYGKEKLPVSIGKNVNEQGNVYVGLTMGVSIPIWYFAYQNNGMAQFGYQLNGIEFGYLFSKHIGASVSIFLAQNSISIDSIDPWRYGSLMIGPMFTLKIAEQIDWEVIPKIGYALSTVPSLGHGAEEASSISYGVGTQFRYHLNKHFYILLNSDYYLSQPSFKYYQFSQTISTISVRFGAAYRL